MLKDLILYARPQEPDLIRFDIRAIIGSVERALRERARDAHVLIDVSCQNNQPEVIADPSQLTRALASVGEYVLSATEKGGKILISTSADEEKGNAEVTVFGSPVTRPVRGPDDVSALSFRPGKVREDLGLALSSLIVKGHGGEIRAEGSPGGGIVFRIMIPFKG